MPDLQNPPKNFPAKVIIDLRVEFKDGRVLEVPKELEPSFDLSKNGFLFIYYRPVMTANAKEQLDLTFDRRWYRLDDIARISEVHTERRTDAADIRGFKLENVKALKNVPDATKGEEYLPAPEPVLPEAK